MATTPLPCQYIACSRRPPTGEARSPQSNLPNVVRRNDSLFNPNASRAGTLRRCTAGPSHIWSSTCPAWCRTRSSGRRRTPRSRPPRPSRPPPPPPPWPPEATRHFHLRLRRSSSSVRSARRSHDRQTGAGLRWGLSPFSPSRGAGELSPLPSTPSSTFVKPLETQNVLNSHAPVNSNRRARRRCSPRMERGNTSTSIRGSMDSRGGQEV